MLVPRRTLLKGAAASLILPRSVRAMPRGAASATNTLLPNQVTSSTLELWLKADAGTLDGSGNPSVNNGVVATWEDQSGDANHATQTTNSSRPILYTNQVGSLPAVGCESDQFFNNAYTGEPGTVFVVYQQRDNSGGESLFGADSSTANPLGAYAFSASDSGSGTCTWGRQINGQSFGGPQTQSTPGQLQLLCFTNDGTTSKLYRGLTLCQSSTNPAGTPATISGSVVIGAQRNNGANQYPCHAIFFETCWYTGKLSDSDRIGVTNYLNQRWGLVPTGNYVSLSFQRPATGTVNTAQLLMWQGGDGQNFETIPCSYVSTFAQKCCRDTTIMYDPVSGNYFCMSCNGGPASYGATSTSFSVAVSTGPPRWNFTDLYAVDCTSISPSPGIYEPRLLMNLNGTPFNPGDGLYHFSLVYNNNNIYHISVSPTNLLSGNGSGWNFVNAFASQPSRTLDTWWFNDGSEYVLWLVNANPGGGNAETIEIWTSSSIDSGYTGLKTGDWAGWLASIGQTLIEHPCPYKLPNGNWANTFDGPDQETTWFSQTTSSTGYKGGGSWSAPVELGIGSFANAVEGFSIVQGNAY